MPEDHTILISAIVVLLGILAAIIIGNHFRKKTGDDTKKYLKEERQKATSETVDALNAFERVQKKGGKVVYRDEQEVVGADLLDSQNDTVEIKEDVVAVLKNEKTGEKKVVSRHEKEFTIDAVLVNESDQKEPPKDEKKVVSRHEVNHSTDSEISESKEEKKEKNQKDSENS